ncbi:ATP-dependent DNA helicase DinG [Salipaludibacillus sp. CUR1]|uniref:ATP-dependent DNA helicase DinG n=1 Tax=Salipaludibacillus sp. CUR1 TaxID=2820003 RepID=UPI001E29E5A8|nr:ATP-dependent DNA helicase DinG [Salipaludibacillus sp. CUR1]MCE7792142.1 ATP-dependent DNA helicase DinG [Salipaludibacillus sp. CUR1]
MNRFVVLDVETTGVSFSRGDRIIQLAYSVVENEQIIHRYSTYINPERSIPPFIKSLTNIHEKHVSEAPVFSEIAPGLLEELEGAYFVAHNVEFDLNFINDELVNAGYVPFEGPVIDTVELSRIAFPTQDSFKLSQLTESFEMDHFEPHRADSDAEATALLLIEIFQRLSALPLLTLQQLEKLQGRLKSDTGSILREWIELSKSSPEDFPEIDAFRGLAVKEPAGYSGEETAGSIPESVTDFLHSTLENVSFMKEKIPSYERREGQMDMIKFIDDVFKNDSIGLIEAGTGTGKTLGYLIPAALYSRTESGPVVISTETVQLQDQIVSKELPALQQLLPFKIKAALLKGRSHYLCLQKFENILMNDPIDSYDRTLSKAQILVWLTETDTGDVEELSLASGNSRFWEEVASDPRSCSTPQCPWFSRCFYQRARKQSKKADLIITNHSLLFTDMAAEHQILPSYSTLIVDEAHHLEDSATRQFGGKLDYLTMTQLLNDLVREKEGWVPENIWRLMGPGLKEISKEFFELSGQFKQEWNDLFLLLNQYAGKGMAGKNETGRLSKIINSADKFWDTVRETAGRCDNLFKALLKKLNHIIRETDLLLEDKETSDHHQREAEWMAALLFKIEEQYLSFHELILNHEDSSVYWLELETKGPKQSIAVHGSPIQIADKLADNFFAKKDRVILTSATLTVNNQFKYMIHRLGLEDFQVETKQVDSPFSWDKQVSFMVPEDMPLIQEAGEEAYIEAAALQIYRIAHVTKGKMLVLFTSYDMLRKTYFQLKKMLDESFMLIAQGIQTKSRSKLTKNFQQFEQAILFGTSSFWEGVDIPGSDLSAIVMARLPFSPPNDPVFKKRSDTLKEEGHSPFMKLALPQAVIRFKQGFGRLIRSSTDRGIVVVLDRRLTTTRYGKSFTRSLPDIPMIEEPMSEMEERIADWFNQPLIDK